jgi:uncharacterized coiled-coil DUF342 family protein
MADTLEALRADTDRLTKQVGRDRQIAEDRAEALRQELKGIKDEVRGYRQELRGNLAAFEGRFSSVEGQIYGLNAEVREVKNELADFREEVRQLFGVIARFVQKSYASAGRPTRRLHRVGQLSFAARHRGDGVGPRTAIHRFGRLQPRPQPTGQNR